MRNQKVVPAICDATIVIPKSPLAPSTLRIFKRQLLCLFGCACASLRKLKYKALDTKVCADIADVEANISQ